MITRGTYARVLDVLAKPRARLVVLALGVLLVLPSISSGLGSDDYVIGSQLRAETTIPGLSRGPLDLFVFAPGEPRAAHVLVEQGVYAWWADEAVKIAFFRPLASASHALDHALFPASPRLWHAHSIAWFFLALLAASGLYRRIFQRGAPDLAAATLALLLFAMDDAHGPTVGWLAARNALMAFTFATLSVSALDAWRREGSRRAAVAGPVLFGLALLSGEAALGATAYLLAYALFLDEGPLARRLGRLWGHGAVLAVWAVAWVGLGYGTSGTTHYLDPVHEPLAFLAQLVARMPVLLLAQVFLPWSDLWPVYPSVAPALPYIVWGFALVSLAIVALVVAPLVRRDPRARFFALGAVLSVVPISAGPPSDRLLLEPGLGAMALAALVVVAFLRRGDAASATRSSGEGAPGRGRRAVLGASTVAIAVVHVVANLYWLPVRSRTNSFFAPVFARANDTIPKTPDVAGRSVILMNPPFEPLALYASFTRDAEGTPRPAHLRVLATGASAIDVTRVDASTLRVRPERGFLSSAADTMQRSARRPIGRGIVAELEDVVVEVTETTSDGRPAEALFHFRVPLEDASLVFLK